MLTWWGTHSRCTNAQLSPNDKDRKGHNRHVLSCVLESQKKSLHRISNVKFHKLLLETCCLSFHSTRLCTRTRRWRLTVVRAWSLASSSDALHLRVSLTILSARHLRCIVWQSLIIPPDCVLPDRRLITKRHLRRIYQASLFSSNYLDFRFY